MGIGVGLGAASMAALPAGRVTGVYKPSDFSGGALSVTLSGGLALNLSRSMGDGYWSGNTPASFSGGGGLPGVDGGVTGTWRSGDPYLYTDILGQPRD